MHFLLFCEADIKQGTRILSSTLQTFCFCHERNILTLEGSELIIDFPTHNFSPPYQGILCCEFNQPQICGADDMVHEAKSLVETPASLIGVLPQRIRTSTKLEVELGYGFEEQHLNHCANAQMTGTLSPK